MEFYQNLASRCLLDVDRPIADSRLANSARRFYPAVAARVGLVDPQLVVVMRRADLRTEHELFERLHAAPPCAISLSTSPRFALSSHTVE